MDKKMTHTVLPHDAWLQARRELLDKEKQFTRLRDQLSELADAIGAEYDLETIVSGEAFLTTDTDFLNLIAQCVETRTGRKPAFSTSGGTSDARFIKDYAPVAEFGLVGATMHQIDERVPVADIRIAADVYESILDIYFTA